ncbi:MAG: LysR family transcriptional regulator [Pseudomonadota bacterium]
MYFCISATIKNHLDGLLEFCTVADLGSFTLAANALGVSVSFVSRRVSDLENRLGAPLLNRTTRRVALTELGARYHERARVILAEIRGLDAELADEQGRLKGPIRVTAGGRIGEGRVTDALVAFAHHHPAVEIELQIMERRVDLIREGYDLAIRHGMLPDPDLVIRPLDTRRLIVCASPDYVATHGAPRTPQDLTRLPCIGAPDQRWQFHRNGKQIEVKVHSRWLSNNGPALATGCERGLGLARLADTYVGDGLAAGRLLPFLEAYELPPQEIVLIYPKRDRVPYRVQRLIEHLSKEL